MPELQSLAQRLGIAARVHWPGMLKGDVKWGAFRSAEALILPSHQENFGFVVAEAMACSTPVLVSNKVNIWREVEASRCGFVDPGYARRNSQSLSPIPRASHLRIARRCRRNARSGFLTYFDIEVTARDFARAIGFDSGALLSSSAPVRGMTRSGSPQCDSHVPAS